MWPAPRRRAWWRAAICAAALTLLALTVDWAEFAGTVRGADLRWLLVVLAVIHADKVWMAWKWWLLASAANLPLTLGVALKSYYIGSFWGCLLPASVGGDVIRASWLSGQGHDAGKIAWSIVAERALGALAQSVTGLTAVIALAASVHLDAPGIRGALVVFVAFTAIGVLVVFSPSAYDRVGASATRFRWPAIQRAAAKMKTVVLGYRRRPGLLLTFLTLSVAEQAFPMVSTFALARALGIELALGWLLIGVPIILAVSRLPVSLHDYGIKEAAYAMVLSGAGLSLTQSITIAMVDRLLVMVSMLPGAFWTVNTRSTSVPPVEPPAPAMITRADA
jgi:uncharacterized protein (TIRG00374 family)